MHYLDVNNSQFNKDAKMVLFAYSPKSLNYNVMHKRAGHPTFHALKKS